MTYVELSHISLLWTQQEPMAKTGQVKIGKLKRWERRKRVGHGRGWNERLKLGGKKALGKGRQRSNRRWVTGTHGNMGNLVRFD